MKLNKQTLQMLYWKLTKQGDFCRNQNLILLQNTQIHEGAHTQGSVWHGFVSLEREQKIEQIKAQDLQQVYECFWISDATTSKTTTIQNPLAQYMC